MKRKNFRLRILLNLILVFLFSAKSFAHQPDIHKYIVWNAWQIVDNYHSVNYSVMDRRIGEWWINWNGSYPWQVGKVTTGAFREDHDDVVYGYGFPNTTSTHFWDPEGNSCIFNLPDESKMDIFEYCYENSLMKSKCYWNGKKFANDDWLFINVPVLSGPNIPHSNYYRLFLRFDNLANVYKYNQIYVYDVYTNSFPPIRYQPPNGPTLLMNYNIENGTRAKIEAICWEIVGRISHLIGDAGVPAHAHNDVHVFEDNFEQYMWEENELISSERRFQNWRWQDAISSHPDPYGGIIEPVNSNNPIKYFIYTTNQIADRFPSNDEDGDATFISSDVGGNYATYVAPYINHINSLNIIPYEHPVPSGVHEYTANYAFLYSMRSTAGFLWYVYNQFGIQNTPPPIISGFTQNPNILCRGGTVTVKCNLSQGGGESYNWTSENVPLGVSIIYNNNVATIHYNATLLNKAKNVTTGSTDDIRFKLKCTVSNFYGSDNKEYGVIWSSNCSGGGCPWLYVYNSDSATFVADNNILHRSEFTDMIGMNISDFYKLNVQPTFNKDTCNLFLRETERDSNKFNTIKLYAVDHPEGTLIGVTESNDIVMYDNTGVTSTDNAILNNYRDITGIIQYDYQGNKIVNGENGDNIYAHYDSTTQMKMFTDYDIKFGNFFSGGNSDSMALIAEVGDNDLVVNGNLAKDYAGLINIFAGVNSGTRMFARRENSSTIIVPFSQTSDALEHVDVNWNRDYQVSYFSVVPVMYSGFTVTELPMVEAFHSETESHLIDLKFDDTNYVSLDSTDILNLKFENVTPPAVGLLRDYVIFVNGRYSDNTVNENNKLSDIRNSNKLLKAEKYELFTNYPNPFNPITSIKYYAPKNGVVKIRVYDLLGRVVRELVNSFKKEGTYSVEFDGTDFASGVYIYQLEANDVMLTKKMVLIK